MYTAAIILSREKARTGNISIGASLVDGSAINFVSLGESCAATAAIITGDNLRPPALNVVIEVVTKFGRIVEVIIPNDVESTSIVRIDGELV